VIEPVAKSIFAVAIVVSIVGMTRHADLGVQ
jgi:hypothetical protein